MLHFLLHAPIAQSVEQSPLKRTVVGSNPTRRTSESLDAQVAELVYALVLGTSSLRIEGSSPSSPTKQCDTCPGSNSERGHIHFFEMYDVEHELLIDEVTGDVDDPLAIIDVRRRVDVRER